MTTPTDDQLRETLENTRTIAVVGISLKDTRPSYNVAKFLDQAGYRIIPINPGHAGEELFGQTIYATLEDIPEDVGRIDMLDIFRRSEQVFSIVESAIATLSDRGLKTVWMQIGVVNEDAAALARSAGLDVIMNLCPKIEHERLIGK